MRNWFILFTTTFTITTLILTITTWFIPYITAFNSQYIILLAVSSALISLFMMFFNRLPIDHIVLNILIDIVFIFAAVYGTGIVIGLIPVNLFNFILVLALVVIIYIIITLIYMSILKIEAKDMNEKILQWRENHVKGNSFK